MDKPILCLDFDGVIHSYTSGWQGIDVIPDPPVLGAIEFMYEAIEHFRVCIYSARSSDPKGVLAMQSWLAKWESIYWHEKKIQPRTSLVLCIDFPKSKPSAFVTIDDRAIRFDGTFPSMEFIKDFKTWQGK